MDEGDGESARAPSKPRRLDVVDSSSKYRALEKNTSENVENDREPLHSVTFLLWCVGRR